MGQAQESRPDKTPFNLPQSVSMANGMNARLFLRRHPQPVCSFFRSALLLAALLLIACEFCMIHEAGAEDRKENQGRISAVDVAQTADVMLDGQILFKVRGVTAFPAERRADFISRRIEALASNETRSLEGLHVEEAPDRSIIKLSGEAIAQVFDPDAEIEGVSRQLLAESYAGRIKEAVTKYRRDRSPHDLMIDTLYALGATAAVALTIFLIVRAFRRLERGAEARYRAKVEALGSRVFPVVDGEQLWEVMRSSARMARNLVLLVLALFYIQLVLGLYPWTRSLSGQLLALVLDPLRTIGLAVVDAVPNVIFLIILAFVTRYIIRLLKIYFMGLQQKTITISGFDPEWAIPTFRLVRLLVVAFALVAAYPYIPGSQSEAFKGLSILLGVIFSLGSSSAVANMIAGYTMIYRRAFKVGDRIKVENLVGDVTEIRLQVTHLRSLSNEEITVPNSTIQNSSVTNLSVLARERGLGLNTTIGVGYDVPWRQVESLLLEAADRTPGLLRDPPPFVMLRSLDDFAVKYTLCFSCNQPQVSHTLYNALHRNILDLFNEHGVQIMTPAYEGDPDHPKVVPKDRWCAPPAKDVERIERLERDADKRLA
ncbi:MAG: mechanosensitive ion channel family protein [Nitrospira sp.]|nr:mechanosensitive ion channel family protein [Nitrospira sp.]